ncbi:MAG: ACR3 family arsenite efflux transporter [Chloroflexi bacterium]|nr:ACR3 family arsenite efflux transporter [Chloroflexota bacterium]
MTETTASPSIASRLSGLDRYLPVWIIAAMVLGVLIGKAVPDLKLDLERIRFADVSLPVGIGLIWMMYPILMKVRFSRMVKVSAQPRLMSLSLFLNWVVGPFLMFGLAWVMLPDMPEFRNGLIMVGLARCIAMVLVWNMLARGNQELAAVLVALNSVFQILFYSILGYFFLTVLPGWLGDDAATVSISMWQIARNVLLFLGLPFVMAAISRYVLVRWKSENWFEEKILPKLGPAALIGLLYTIVIMFISQGDRIVDSPVDVLRVAIPLVSYFVIMFTLAFVLSRWTGLNYEDTTAVSFTAAGNNFELAIAVAVGVYGISSSEAFATVIGPLVEVPALVGIVYLSLWLGRMLFRQSPTTRATRA